MRFYPHTDSLGDEMTRSDWRDRDAQYLADDAEAFRRNYATINERQAKDLERAVEAINDVLASYAKKNGTMQ